MTIKEKVKAKFSRPVRWCEEHEEVADLTIHECEKKKEQLKLDFENYLKRKFEAKHPTIRMFPETVSSSAMQEFVNTYTEFMVKQEHQKTLEEIENLFIAPEGAEVYVIDAKKFNELKSQIQKKEVN